MTDIIFDDVPERDPAVSKALADALAALRTTDDPFKKLVIVQEGARRLEPFDDNDAIDRLSEIAIRAHGLDEDDVQTALIHGLDQSQQQRLSRAGAKPNGEIPDFDPRPPAFADDAIALRFAEQHQHGIRYVDDWGKWLYWDGTCWRQDNTRLAFDWSRKICRTAAAECNKARVATALASAKTVAAVERLAKSDRRIAAVVDQWDADPWLLNTPGGVVNLKSGDIREARQADYITKITAVAPGGDCPVWIRFLDRITGANQELQQFLQRVAGYGLTGLTQEHALFFAYGTGANGKSVFLSTAAGIMGDYHRSAPIETFTASTSDRHPTDLAGLRGARLVTAVETEEGRRWAESKIKTLTGGDRIAARFMRQDFFEYVPQFKLLIAGNHKPGLRSVDEAIRRRFHLIPFAVTIPPEERDITLPDRLRAEWPGILAWMIQGCLDWQECGLSPPAIVQEATAAYLEAEDATAAWIDAACRRDANAWESSTDLFSSWKAWAERSGEFAGNIKRFVANLETKGYPPHRKTMGRGHFGLQISRSDETQNSRWTDYDGR